jgi:hypothetical protein
MGMRPTRRRQDDHRAADRTTMARIAMALKLIEAADQQWVGLARWMAHSGMDRDAELLDRLAARAARMERDERFRAEARASRRREA